MFAMASARPLDRTAVLQIRDCLLSFENCTGQVDQVFSRFRSRWRSRISDIRSFRVFLNDYPEIFIVNMFERKDYVSLTTQLTVCPAHSKKSGSCRPGFGQYSCGNLHVCVFYLLSGICDFGDSCFFGHSLQTAHDQPLLEDHFLDGLSLQNLRAIFTRPFVRRGVTRPQVCRYYNSQQGCRKEEGKFGCRSLHICRHYVMNDCRFGIECQFNHDVLGDDQVEDVMELYGVSIKRRPKLILEDLFMYMREEEEGSQVRNHALWLETQSTQGSQPLHMLSRAVSVPNLRQTALSPPSRAREICRFYLQGRCKFGSSCRNLHSSPARQPPSSPARSANEKLPALTRMLSDVGGLLETMSLDYSSASSSFPSYWSDMKGKEYLVVKLSSSNSEFNKVLSRFQKDLPRARVASIKRIQNRGMWDLYFAQKQSMERKYGVGKANELSLFHGTPMKSVESILIQNIDPLMAGSNVGAKYGRGAYFAVDSLFSDSYTSTSLADSTYRYMFYARVLAGLVTRGEASMQRPPQRNPSDPSSLHDAVVDNVTSPRIYVIFRNQQIYPEYLIQYQR